MQVDAVRDDVARARRSAMNGIGIGVLGVVVAVVLIGIAARLELPAGGGSSPRTLFAGLGVIALGLGAWSVVDHGLRARTLGRILARPGDVVAIEPATLRRQPAARIRLTDRRCVVIPTREHLRGGGGEG